MEYTSVTLQDKIQGLRNRVRQLEEEYFTNEVYLTEAGLLGSQKDVDDFTAKNAGVELRRNALLELIEKLLGTNDQQGTE